MNAFSTHKERQLEMSLTSKLLGSFRRSAHVPGHPDVAYELPAQSPQKVMSARLKVNLGRIDPSIRNTHRKQSND